MKKLKSESGSAMILALFLMILVSIVMISFSNQVANQIRSTINLNENMQKRYDIESKIEECISDFIKSINLENNSMRYTKPSDKYVIEYKDKNKNTIKSIVEIKTMVEIKFIGSNQNPPQNNPIQISSDTKSIGFKLEVKEINDNKSEIKSYINVNLSKTDGTETWNADYGVESWRERN